MRCGILLGSMLGLGALLAVQPAQATIITQVAHGGGYGCDTTDVMFQQAHIVPGEHLSSVNMSISAGGDASAAITPDNGFPVDANVFVSVGVTVNGPGIPFKMPLLHQRFRSAREPDSGLGERV